MILLCKLLVLQSYFEMGGSVAVWIWVFFCYPFLSQELLF